MKLVFKLTFIVALISLCLGDNINPNFLETYSEISDMTGEESQILFNNNAESYINSLNGFSIVDCVKELKKLKSVYDTIKANKGVAEKIFYGTKSLVENFPGLKKNCSIPLPNVDTSKWTVEKFKKVSCTATVITSFAITSSSCVSGSIFLCPAAVSLLGEVSDCIKLLID
jgi:hypothetical protein